jgi:hypothetical protein
VTRSLLLCWLKVACILVESWAVRNPLCIRISLPNQKRKRSRSVFTSSSLMSSIEGTILDALGLGHLKRSPLSRSQGGGGNLPSVNLTRRHSDASEGSQESRLSQESRFAQEQHKYEKVPDEACKEDDASQENEYAKPKQVFAATRNQQKYTPRLDDIREASGSVVDASPMKKKFKCILCWLTLS